MKRTAFYILITCAAHSSFALGELTSRLTSSSPHSDGVLQRAASSPVKTTAKVAACKSVAKGICLGVAGAKYISGGVGESKDDIHTVGETQKDQLAQPADDNSDSNGYVDLNKKPSLGDTSN